MGRWMNELYLGRILRGVERSSLGAVELKKEDMQLKKKSDF